MQGPLPRTCTLARAYGPQEALHPRVYFSHRGTVSSPNHRNGGRVISFSRGSTQSEIQGRKEKSRSYNPRVLWWCWRFSHSVLSISGPMDCSPPGSSSMGFSRQEYWSGLPFPSEDLPDPNLCEACEVFCIAGGFFTN